MFYTCTRKDIVMFREQDRKLNACDHVVLVLRLLLLLLSTLPVRHWREYTEGRACSKCLPIA